MLAEQCKEQVSQQRIVFMVQQLTPLGESEVVTALTKLLESARRFPTIAEIKEQMGLAGATPRDAANEIASVILTTVARVGVPVGPSGVRARDGMLGDAALFIVDKLGGWNTVVDQAGENVTALRAQIRDLAEGYIRSGHVVPDGPRQLPSYGAALALAERPAPTLPAPKRESLEAHAHRIEGIKSRLEQKQISDGEALDLLKAADGQFKLDQDQEGPKC